MAIPEHSRQLLMPVLNRYACPYFLKPVTPLRDNLLNLPGLFISRQEHSIISGKLVFAKKPFSGSFNGAPQTRSVPTPSKRGLKTGAKSLKKAITEGTVGLCRPV